MKAIRFDGVLWIRETKYSDLVPHCPIHRMEMDQWVIEPGDEDLLRCPDCEKHVQLPRIYDDEVTYIERKLKSKDYENLEILNLDGESVPVAEDNISTPDNKYFVRARLMKTRVGPLVVVYAGEKSASDKAQVFVEPNKRRVSFDPKNIHPSDVLAKLEVTFADGSKQTINKKTRKQG